ncbi:MAG: transglycosylase domain-containing protein [Oscillospiraceae bacterium]|nr:transglycosylase domain-containing protein [Oscillospiraceae bacterium]
MKKFFRRLMALILIAVIARGAVAAPVIKDGYQLYKQVTERMPVQQKVDEIRAQAAYTPFEDISPVFIDTLLESEDRRFYSHCGLDPISLIRAVAANAIHGRYIQGGSTITQQLAKNMYFSFEKQLSRKVAELFVALQLEGLYSKEEILALYCTLAYFGQNCYGVKEAGGYYYGVEPSQLDSQQSRELVRALKAPSVYNPSTIRR